MLEFPIFFAIEQETPNPPSPKSIDQHAVVTLTIPCTFVTILGVICEVLELPLILKAADARLRPI
jgi:hypothetical protein